MYLKLETYDSKFLKDLITLLSGDEPNGHKNRAKISSQTK